MVTEAFIFAALSSSGSGPYHVEFAFLDDGRLSIQCSCQAGLMGDMCKHRAALIRGDESILAAPDDHLVIYRQVLPRIAASNVPYHCECLDRDLKALDREKADLKLRYSQRKKQFARELAEGV